MIVTHTSTCSVFGKFLETKPFNQIIMDVVIPSQGSVGLFQSSHDRIGLSVPSHSETVMS